MNDPRPRLQWDNATSLSCKTARHHPAPQGSFVHDIEQKCDQIAVVYDKGQTPPRITIAQVSNSVHTVLADGVAVAVVARANGPAPSASDVLLVERSC